MIKLRLLEAINYNYYKDKISKEKFDELINMDPSSGNKYSAWLVNKYLGNKETKDHIDSIEWPVIAQLLKYYDKYKSKNIIPAPYNDINKFASTLDLQTYIKENIEDFEKRLQAKIDSKGKTAKIIYKDARNLVVIPSTYEASRKYGTGTNWCTASASDYHYNSYMADGVLYIHRFLNEDGSFADNAYQLYIPKEGAKDYPKVECNDAPNHKVMSIKETFLDDLPEEIVNEFLEKIEAAGGYEKEFTIHVSMNADTEDGRIKLYLYYELYEISDDNYEPVGNESISSMIVIFPVGKDAPLLEEENPLESAILDSNEFNFENGTGLLVTIYGDSPNTLETQAERAWGDQVGYWDSNIDNYEATQEMKKLNKYKFDYLIINQKEEDDIDPLIEDIIGSYIKNILSDRETLSIDNEKGETYTIYFRTGYNYTSTGDWTSTPRQRKLDRQLDFPDMD